MMSDASFFQTARSLSRNPLGIIALFIVLVYAVASIVISHADEKFYEHPFHPAILFLAAFPIVVLSVFAYLVAYYHRHLYAPGDYANQAHFLFDHLVPPSIRTGYARAATSDTSGAEASAELVSSIESSYKRLLDFGFVLVHQVEVLQPRTSPNSGRYRVRIWIEPLLPGKRLSDIASVTYHIWPDFIQPVLTTSDLESEFDLWMTLYGEFPVLAVVTLKDGESLELQRFLDLPGRPPD